jgi:methyl-accepting chemotaxis protein
MACAVAEYNHLKSQDESHLKRVYGPRLRDIVGMAMSVLRENQELVEQGRLTLPQAQQQATEALRRIRYDNGVGYVWINSNERPICRLIMHPISPELEGRTLDGPEYNRVAGGTRNLFQALVEACEQDGEGFISYTWPKPHGDGTGTTDEPKLSFVKRFEPWQWIVGTGIYVDDAVADAKAATTAELRKMRFAGGEGYFWINDCALPYPSMVMHAALPSLEGQRLDDPRFDCARGRENLFRVVVQVCRQRGEGVVHYHWPKPTRDGSVRMQPKLSYVKRFAPWDWVIGTGVHVDNIDNRIALQGEAMGNHLDLLILKIVGVSLVVVLLAVILSLVISHGLSSPLRRLIRTMESVELGSLSTTRIALQGPEEIQELGGIFNQMLISLQDAVVELRETTAAKERIEGELGVAREIQQSIIPLAARGTTG